MIGFRAVALATLALLLTVHSNAARCGYIEGRVIDVRTGAGISQAAVVVEVGQLESGLKALTMFTDPNGRYSVDTSAIPARQPATIRSQVLGLVQKSPTAEPTRINIPEATETLRIDFAMERMSNIAGQVPASAWLAKAPESDAKHETQLHCTGCHQLPTPKVMDYARKIEAAPNAGGSNLGSKTTWHDQVRKEAWRAAVKYMRAKSYDIFPEGTTIDLAKIDWKTIQAPEYSLFTARDEGVVADFLTRYLPRQFDYLAPDDYSLGAPLGVTPNTVIREFQLPDSSLVRELTSVRGSKMLWGADIQKNRLLMLDPATGGTVWFDVPHPSATGPHTILGDEHGNVWLSLLESDQLARFNPTTRQWKLYALRPSDMDPKNFFGGQAIVHDISFGEDYELRTDMKGQIWLTLIGTNKLASLNPETGEVHHYDAPPVQGRDPLNISLYSVLLSKDGGCAWFTQLMGSIGCLNTRTLKLESMFKPPSGSGPRRLSIDPDQNLWVPYFGSGQILKYDTSKRKIAKVYDLPNRSAAPYAVTWDTQRKVLWVANANADVIYRFDPSTEKFSIIPLPRPMGYLRKISVDLASGDLVTSYANIPPGSGPSMALSIHVGD